DLKYHFPFLDEAQCAHPYQMHYYVWKLSFLFGRRFAHHSVAFEELVLNADSVLPSLLDALHVQNYELDQLKAVLVRPDLGKWRSYADESWFQEHESACETVLAEFFGQPPSDNSSTATRALVRRTSSRSSKAGILRD